MRLIVLTAPAWRDDEIALLTAMFECGLETLHLRKPGCTKQEIEQVLRELPARFYDRIVLHAHYELAEEYGVRGIHLPEGFRTNRPEFAREWKRRFPERHLSTSMHDMEMVMQPHREFDYIFLSPVFDSISKSGYTAAFKPDRLEHILHFSPNAVIALGGVIPEKIEMLQTMGFAGCAVLGFVWEATDPVDAFIQLRDTLRE